MPICPTVTKLGAHVQCANTHKAVEQIFEILILKFLAIFLLLNFAFGLSLWLAQQQRSSHKPTGIVTRTRSV